MRKTIFIFLVSLSFFLIVFRLSSKHILQFLESNNRSGIRVDTNPAATVLIDKTEVGKTPIQKEDLKKGDRLVEVKSDQGVWQGYVKLNTGTLTVVNRDLNKNNPSSSGEVITLEKGEGVSVISSPSEADVEVNGVNKGKTPVLLTGLSAGEHLFLISKPNFLTRSIRSVVTDGYRLGINVDLAVAELDVTQVPTTPIQATPMVEVLPTPTGFLRVRSSDNTSSAEVARVFPGDKLQLLEEVPNWKKVKLSDGKEGYVAAQYVRKLTP